MSDDEHSEEDAEEAIEDLEAPADAQVDVAGGGCVDYTHHWCIDPSCAESKCEAGAGGGQSFVIREL